MDKAKILSTGRAIIGIYGNILARHGIDPGDSTVWADDDFIYLTLVGQSGTKTIDVNAEVPEGSTVDDILASVRAGLGDFDADAEYDELALGGFAGISKRNLSPSRYLHNLEEDGRIFDELEDNLSEVAIIGYLADHPEDGGEVE